VFYSERPKMRVEQLLGALSGFLWRRYGREKSKVKSPTLSKTESMGHPKHS